MQMNYKSSSSPTAMRLDAEHKVTLNNMVTLFADVMTS